MAPGGVFVINIIEWQLGPGNKKPEGKFPSGEAAYGPGCMESMVTSNFKVAPGGMLPCPLSP